MKRIVVHQWRDWLLEQVSSEEYELKKKDGESVHTVQAKNAMDAENQSREIIKNWREETI